MWGGVGWDGMDEWAFLEGRLSAVSVGAAGDLGNTLVDAINWF